MTFQPRHPNPLVALRTLRPAKHLSRPAEFRVAERQAARLLQACNAGLPPYEAELLARFPRLKIVHEHDVPVAGSTHWTGRFWIIVLNADDTSIHQRATLFHELHHVICHPFRHLMLDETTIEAAADHFSTCVLMPEPMMRRCWRAGIRYPSELADLYEVAPNAMRARLRHLGLNWHQRPGNGTDAARGKR